MDVPSRGLVIVNQYENEPATHDSRSVLLAAQDKRAIFDDQADHLMKMILDSRAGPLSDSTAN